MEHNIKTYMDKPMGKGASAFNLKSTRDDLDRRFKKLTETKKIELKHVCRTGGTYLLHFIIPSESERKNTYDVVLEFSPNSILSSNSSVREYKLRFFSNCPSFVYTFAHVYNKEKLFIKEFADKYDKEIFKLKPVEKNPYNIVNFEKSIYFAIKFLDKGGLYHYNKGYLDGKVDVDFQKLKSEIRNTDEIKMEYLKEKNRLRDEKRKEKGKVNDLKAASHNKSRDLGSNKNVRTVNTIKPTKSTTSSSVVSRVGRISSSINRLKGRRK